jgi:hypothetical protein
LETSSTDAKVATDVQTELKDQVERTLLKSWYSWAHSILLIILVMGVPLAFVFFLYPTATMPILGEQDAIALSTAAKNATSSDQKIDFIFSYLSKQLFEFQKQSASARLHDFLTPRNLWIGLPLLLFAGVFYYTILTCFPGRVFLWGDYALFTNV